MHGRDHAREAQDEEDVEDVAAQHVADGNAAIALLGRHDARGQFGQRGAARHDGQSDDGVAHVQRPCHLGSAADKEVAAADEGGQSHDHPQAGQPALHGLLGRSLVGCGLLGCLTLGCLSLGRLRRRLGRGGALDREAHEDEEEDEEDGAVEACDDPVVLTHHE